MSLEPIGAAFLRASGILAAFPQALGTAVPLPLRLLAAAGLALAHARPGEALGGPVAGLVELGFGLGLGFCLRLPILACQAAGETVGFTTQASTLLMPALSEDAGGGGSAWGAAFTLLGLLVWFNAGGPEALYQAFGGSLRLAPVGSLQAGSWTSAEGLGELSRLLARSAAMTMVLCLPPLLASLLVQWGLGLVFRASAQLQMYGFALPFASLAAAGALALALPSWPGLLQRHIVWSLEAAAGWTQIMGGR